MKHLKMSMMLLFIVALFNSCEKETTSLLKSSELNNETIKENIKAKLNLSAEIGEGLYALAPWDSQENIARYDYNPLDDYISIDYNFIFSTGTANNYGFDFNIKDGFIYLLAANPETESSARFLYSIDPLTREITELAQIISVEGNTKPQDLTFDTNGTLYFVFQSGEVNSYDISTQTISAFSNVEQDGAVGLTYDFDNNRLLYVTSNNPIYLFGINIPSGGVDELFQFYTPGERGSCTAQGIEYLGNNKVISTSTFGCNIIYTVDLLTEETNLLLDGTNSYSSIKDLMYLSNPDFDNDGVLNEDDPYPHSNMSETLSIGYNYLNIENVFTGSGTTMMDQIDALIAEMNAQYNGDNYAYLHRQFMSKLSKITYYWTKDRLITRRERSAIYSAASSASIPYFNLPG